MTEIDPRVDLLAKAGITSALPEGFIPRCPSCRYDLRGLSQSKCPECGARFSMDLLIIEWRQRKAAAPSDADFYIAALLSMIAFIPANITNPASFLWKLTLLGALWTAATIWYKRRADDLREPEEGHRLLWLCIPCAVTAMALSRTPGLGLFTAILMAGAAAVIAVIAGRRAPLRTSVIITLTLAAPLGLIILMGFGMLMSGLAGRGQGHHWSGADFPSWYWRGISGRVRGMSSPQAVSIGSAMLGVGVAGALALLGLWLLIARRWLGRWRARRTAPGEHPSRVHL